MTNRALDEVIAELREKLVDLEFGSIRVVDVRRDEGSGSGDEDDDLRLLILLERPSDAEAGAWPPDDAFALRRAIARWWATRDDVDLPLITPVLLPADPESQDFDPGVEGDLGQAVEGDDERSDPDSTPRAAVRRPRITAERSRRPTTRCSTS